MTAQQLHDCVVLDGADVGLLHGLAVAGLDALSRRNGIASPAQAQELLAVLARTRDTIRARSALSARGQAMDAATLGGSSSEHPSEVGTVAAARLLGVDPRTVRRQAPGLGGHQVSGRWIYDTAVIKAAAEARKRSKE